LQAFADWHVGDKLKQAVCILDRGGRGGEISIASPAVGTQLRIVIVANRAKYLCKDVSTVGSIASDLGTAYPSDCKYELLGLTLPYK
jgi:hypothetical protein